MLIPRLLIGLLLLAGPAAWAQKIDDQPPTKEPPKAAQRSDSGLAWIVIRPGDGRRPDGNDMVSIHYVGWTPAGARFDSSYDRGKPTTFSVEQVFPAFREVLPGMSVDEKRRLWVPAHLANPNPPTGPRGAVIFDVELMGFLSMANPPAELTTPPGDAFPTEYGAHTKVIGEGTGKVKAATGAGALLNYTVWTADGKVHDTNAQRGRPTLFLFHNVMPAFADCVKQMVEGERRHLWIPGAVAAGNWVKAPQGMLIFEIELVRIVDDSILEGGP